MLFHWAYRICGIPAPLYGQRSHPNRQASEVERLEVRPELRHGVDRQADRMKTETGHSSRPSVSFARRDRI